MTPEAIAAQETTQAALVAADAWRTAAEAKRRAIPPSDHAALMAALREEHTAWCLARALWHAFAMLDAP